MMRPARVFDPALSRYRCQYLVVGTGPGGSVAGERLAAAGRDVLFLEEGVWPAAHEPRILESMQKFYRYGSFLPLLGRPMVRFAEGVAVGGGSVINGGVIHRPPQWVLESWQNDFGLAEY